MALVFFACWIVWALREVGPVGFLKELFAPKGESTGFMKLLMIVVIGIGLTACNTMRGVGKDIEAGGEAIQKATK